uniref:BMP-binding endothelial regulator protein n=1 Tax=Acrobeloides nanus TaxID=290746 RepID=A0A914C8A5_9BILA
MNRFLLVCSFVLFSLALTSSTENEKQQLIGEGVHCDKEGEDWPIDSVINGTRNPQCIECKCRDHKIVCTENLCQDLLTCPLTEPFDPEECCPKCLTCNYLGITRYNNEKWKNPQDSCSIMTCKAGIITSSRIECVTYCEKSVVMTGYCCRLCPMLKNTTDRQKDPCLICEPVLGLYQHCYRLACPVLDCPEYMHREINGTCCPECDPRLNNTNFNTTISGQVAYRTRTIPPQENCIFRDKKYSLGSSFRVDTCTLCSCQQGGILCRRLSCSSRTCDGSTSRNNDSLCCPFCKKEIAMSTIPPRRKLSDCTQSLENGTLLIQKNGTRWKIEECTICQCVDGLTTCKTQRCIEHQGTCRHGHKRVKLHGQCCPTCQQDEATCTVFGDPHYETFDHRRYEYRGAGSYILIQQRSLRDQRPDFQIIAHNDGKGTQIWTRRLTILLLNQKIQLNEERKIEIQGHENISLPYLSKTLPIYEIGIDQTGSLLLIVPNMSITVLWDGQTLLEITLGSQHRSKVRGLCGNFNGESEDDFLLQFEDTVTTDVRTFVESWKTMDKCTSNVGNKTKILRCKDPKLTKLKKTELASCNLLKHNKFLKSCHCSIPIQSFMRKCKKAVCDCQKPENNTYPCHCDAVNQSLL